MIPTEDEVRHTETILWALAKLLEELKFYNDLDSQRPERVKDILSKEEASVRETFDKINNGELVITEKEMLND